MKVIARDVERSVDELSSYDPTEDPAAQQWYRDRRRRNLGNAAIISAIVASTSIAAIFPEATLQAVDAVTEVIDSSDN